MAIVHWLAWLSGGTFGWVYNVDVLGEGEALLSSRRGLHCHSLVIIALQELQFAIIIIVLSALPF